MSSRQIHVFISHSWKYSGHYDTLSGWIFDQNWSAGATSLDFRNYSVPKDDAFEGLRREADLRSAIYRQIAMSHVVVIPTGMYANYSKWISKEIGGANTYGKPILAVNLWGAKKSSSVVLQSATQEVGWTSKSVVNGIWDLYKS